MPDPYRLGPKGSTTCQECPLNGASGVYQKVPTEAHNTPIDVMFIAEAPGRTEDSEGRPVVGRTGRVLRRVVQDLCGGSETHVAYGNVLQCHPIGRDGQDRKPNAKEVGCCRSNILADIDSLQPKQIVLCGDSAAKALARQRNGRAIPPATKITFLRGLDFMVHTPGGLQVPAKVVYHPSHIFRNPTHAQVWREDIAVALGRAQGKISDYSDRGKDAKILTDPREIHQFLSFLVKRLTKQDIVALDYETTGLERIDNRILTIGFAYGPDQGVVIPWQHPEVPWSGKEFAYVRQVVQRFFAQREVSFGALVAHNLKFEAAITLDQLDTYIRMPVECTQLRSHGLNEDRKGSINRGPVGISDDSKDENNVGPYGLKRLCLEHLNFHHYGDDDIRPMVALRNQGRLAEANLRDLAQYNGMDCYVTYRLYRFQQERAIQEGYDAFHNTERALVGPEIVFLAQMERNGMRADKKSFRYLLSPESPLMKELAGLEQRIYNMPNVKKANEIVHQMRYGAAPSGGLFGASRSTPWVFKMNGDDDKRVLFFDVLGLKPLSLTEKTKQPSVSKELYKAYKGVDEIDAYAQWAELDKLRGTYLEGTYRALQQDPDMQDGRIRARYHPEGTGAGRLSCSNPNLLNIPKGKSGLAKAIKRQYIVDPTYCMLAADYSQAEVRWLAAITGDPDLVAAFNTVYQARLDFATNPTEPNRLRLLLEGDFHKHTASMITGVPLLEVSDSDRQAAKAIVFGLNYGMTESGLSKRLKITVKEAKAFIEKFFSRFPRAKAWLEWIEQYGFRKGYVQSPTGRRKRVAAPLLMDAEEYRRYERQRSQGHLRRLLISKSHEDRVCRNAPIQGVASDTNLMACIQLQHYILDHQLDWRIVNTVYDSIMVELPFPDIQRGCSVMQGIMENRDIFKETFGFQMAVPFVADFSVGINWGDQWDISDAEQEWELHCRGCDATRKEEQRPQNQRCEECGSVDVELTLVTGPLSMLTQQLDQRYGLAQAWAERRSS